jgi:hypothetical protein
MLRDLTRNSDKLITVTDPFEICQNDPIVHLVASPRLKQGDFIHIRLVAQADEAREADPLHPAPVEDCRAERPRLRHERDLPGMRVERRKRRIEARGGIDHPQTVGTDHAHVVAARDLQQTLLQDATLRSDLFETRTDHNQPANTTFAACFRHFQRHGSRHNNHSQIDRFWNLFDRRVGWKVQNLRCSRMDGKDATGIPRIENILEDAMSQFRRVG